VRTCAQQRVARGCEQPPGGQHGTEEHDTVVQYQTCAGALECRVDGMRAVLYQNVSAPPDFGVLDQYVATDVSYDMREIQEWDVSDDDGSLFSNTLPNVTSFYVLYFAGLARGAVTYTYIHT
jgi:hypothetical protein